MFSSLTRGRAVLLLSSVNRISGLNGALKLPTLKILNVIQPSNNHEWACNHDNTKYRRKLQNQNFGNFLGYLTDLISVSASLRGKQNNTNFTVSPWVNFAFLMCWCVGDLGCPRTQNMFKWITVKRFCCFHDQCRGIPTLSVCRGIIAWNSSSRVFTGVWPNKKSVYCASCSQDYALISPFIQTFCWGMMGKLIRYDTFGSFGSVGAKIWNSLTDEVRICYQTVGFYQWDSVFLVDMWKCIMCRLFNDGKHCWIQTSWIIIYNVDQRPVKGCQKA